VEVCPYDALFWSREFEYSEFDIRELTHEKERLSDWMATVLPPPPLEQGAALPGEPAYEPTAAPAQTVAATGARPPTTTSSAVEARPEQAADAPKAGTAATTGARDVESAPAEAAPVEAPPEKPAKMTAETTELGEPSTPTPAASEAAVSPSPGLDTAPPPEAAETKPAEKEPAAAAPSEAAAEAEKPSAEEVAVPGPNVEVPHETPQPVALERTEDPQEVYDEVLKEQLDKGSSPQVAEARAKVARVKAERGVRAQAAPAPTPAPQPSAPTQGRPTEPEPSGAPEATTHTPDPGPVAPAPGEGTTGGEDPDAAYRRVLSEEREKGSGETVAMARAKAARVRAQKGTQGPGGSN
jgi:hypothetical protein